MIKKYGFFQETSHQEKIEHTVNNAIAVCKELFDSQLSHLNILDYNYTSTEAMEELGLDEELVHELVEDYVVQIIKASLQFQKQIQELRLIEDVNDKSDYNLLRELAHKNLGVARNLRIKDAQTLLFEIMSHDDLDYLDMCVEALRACAIKLKPQCAYKTLKLIEVKSSL